VFAKTPIETLLATPPQISHAKEVILNESITINNFFFIDIIICKTLKVVYKQGG
jgi:hypothetical protein